ncbi:MAG: hypothetical protein H8E98_08655 [Bacteroidetes bacterium]|nr:hypothetical protein [Bacteroidota bacterium]
MKTKEVLKNILAQIEKCETQEELDQVHRKNCILISEYEQELIPILYKKRCEIIGKSLKK